MSRVIMYVDGFNLYFGLRSKGWRKYYWLDLVQLAQTLIKPEQRLETIHYFTSRILPNGYNFCDIDGRRTVYPSARHGSDDQRPAGAVPPAGALPR